MGAETVQGVFGSLGWNNFLRRGKKKEKKKKGNNIFLSYDQWNERRGHGSGQQKRGRRLGNGRRAGRSVKTANTVSR